MRRQAGSPTWLLVADVDVQAHDDGVGEQRRHPVDDEHDAAAQDGPRQRDPHVVVLEARTPSWNAIETEVTQMHAHAQHDKQMPCGKSPCDKDYNGVTHTGL